MKKFDLVIIGGGAAAFAAAIKANELKKNTVLINAGLPLGGTCVNVGCVPSKKLLWAGEVIHQAKNHNIPGIDIEVKGVNFKDIVKDELNLVDRMRKEKYENVLKELQFVTFIEGKARFTGEGEVEVNNEKIFADKFIIATGSTANVPPIKNIKKVGYITHIEALKLNKQPSELVVIGAGPVGIEFAQMFARFGTKVTVLQHGKYILSFVEKELSSQLQKILEGEGIDIITEAEVESTRTEENKKIITFSVNGEQKEVTVEEILLATGKTPNTQELNLEVVGVQVDEHQAIKVNEFFETNKKGIFAVGDVAVLPLRLETTAGREGTLAAENALSDTKTALNTTLFQILYLPIRKAQVLDIQKINKCKKWEYVLAEPYLLSTFPKLLL